MSTTMRHGALTRADHEQLTGMARRLHWLRYAGVVAQLVVVLAVQYGLGIALPLQAIAIEIVLLLAFNLAIGLRLRSERAVSAIELLGHLLVDVAALLALLYFSGGSGNPFVSFFLVPLIVAAVVLPGRHVLAMAAVTLGCYTALMFFHWPLPSHQFNLHVIGMWLNFVLSAALVLGVVARMARDLRRRDAELAGAREQALRDEHIVALGSLAAGAAHDLATPLATMAVLARESEGQAAGQPELADNMRCLREQLDTCKHTLGRLRRVDIEEHARSRLAADAFLEHTLRDWQRLRPTVPVDFAWSGPAPELLVEPALTQTLTNLINNAADASPTGMLVRGRRDGDQLAIDIRDAGPGIGPEVARRAGKAPVSTKKDGHGVGLLLANATIERLGGEVSVVNHEPHGACTRIRVPLQSLAAA